MAITSLSFLVFLFAVFLCYYVCPKAWRWTVLLVASAVFYLLSDWKNIFYVWFTASTVYAATRWMQRLSDRQRVYLKENRDSLTKEEKTRYRAKTKRRRKGILIGTLLVNLAILCAFKYFHFAVAQLNGLLSMLGGRQIPDSFRFLAPLGISFYTFQAIGYLVDVYWENLSAERNYAKLLLFVSFFPQMTQGPISEYGTLSKELFTPHSFSARGFTEGVQRLIWGFCKKMLIADVLATYVGDVFANYAAYSGLTVLIGAFFYSVQIYADFSGYMDIMCGFCQTLGIRLTENFLRPYFSKSISEYWRRWHISLGAWFKRYIYYPIGMSAWSRKLAKSSKRRFGKHFGDTLPASIALVVVWLATGLWHGASWAYIVWGLVNGLFIIFSLWMEPVYRRCRAALKIREDALPWRAFQVLRTFCLVTLIKVLPEVGSLSDGLGLIRRIFTGFRVPHGLHELLPFVDWSLNITQIFFALSLVGMAAMLLISLLQRKRPVRDRFNRLPMPVRVLILACATILICSFGVQATWDAGGFLYANF